MANVHCPACGRSHSEFDTRCAGCGEPLPLLSTGEVTTPGAGGDPLVGRTIGHFRVDGLLGRGAMGVVYRARDLDLDRDVALKELAPLVGRRGQDDERFRREARAAAALDHPNLGTVHEIFQHGDRRFIALAFYDGETLAQHLARAPERRLSGEEVVAIAGQLAAALAAAHAAGIVHRDVKPENVMLLPDGRLKLVDFGLARPADATPLTEAGVAVGTAAYLPPEAFRGEAAGAAGDVWALGVLLYELLAGCRPFGGERPGMVHRILHEAPEPLALLRPDAPATLVRLVESCLAKEPQDRPAGGREILAELAAAGLWTGSVAAFSRPRRGTSRWPWLVAAGGALALAVAGWWAFSGRASEPTVYVAVAEPRVTSGEPETDPSAIAANLQAAVLRAVAGLEGVAAVDPAQVRAVPGDPLELARAVAASEVLRAEAVCSGETCQVRLSRLGGADGSVLWATALQLPPSRPLLFAEAITAAVRQGYPERRPRFGPRALAIDEADFARYLELRHSLAAAPDLDQLLADLGELRRRAPGFVDLYALEASVARRRFTESGEQHYLDHGLKIARQARELAPGDPRPLVNLFELELHAGNLDAAQTVLDELATIDPAATLLRRGQLAERRGQDEEALERLTAAVRMQPSWRALLILANTEYRLGLLPAAREHLGELLDRSPGNVEGLRALAQIELLDDPPRATKLLEELVARRPDAGALSNLGVALLLQRRYEEAEARFRAALDLLPEDASATLNLADCLTLLGRDEEARTLYRALLAADPPPPTLGNWPRFSIAAQAHAHLGETDAAIAAIQQALRLTPDNAQLALEAAVVYIAIGDRGSALFHARRAAARGLDPRWFAFPWFDTLRAEPGFPAPETPR
ncbi:MAG: protein kinase [Thermoanaerobaculia bacterium]|nr:protein kinase [Thermoanaerobaculia bacterium]